MKSTLKQIIEKHKEEEKAYAVSREAEINNPETGTNRRDFLKKTALWEEQQSSKYIPIKVFTD
jgi:hypothetical protein